MYEQHDFRRQFLSAPVSVAAAVAALMDPAIAALALVLCHLWYHQPFNGDSVTLLILATVLVFPGVNRFGRKGSELVAGTVLAWCGVVMVLVVIGYATKGWHQFHRGVLYAWLVATPTLQILGSYLGTLIIQRRLNEPDQRRAAVVVGANRIGARVIEMLESQRALGQDYRGVFDDRTEDRLELPQGCRLTGTLADLPAFIDRHGVKDVYVTLPLSSQPRILKLMESLQNTTASLHYVPDVFGVTIIQGRLEDVGGVPVVGLTVTPFTGINGLVKRLSDIVLSLLILILISPLLLVLAVGVKLSSPGPVLFRQLRTGLDGEIITVYKFRSMTTQDNGPEIRQATRGDARVTPFGAFIRRTSLDELPQFINVLQGRMSIVGPRPHAVAHNNQYRQLVKAYMARHKVRPGITGWAQVNGFRGETDTLDKMQRRVEYDLEYLRNWSLGLDLQIILKTIKLVFADKSAY